MKKILFVLHVPPPIHGSSIMGEFIKDSKKVNSEFYTEFINLSTSKEIDEIGKKILSKILPYLLIIAKTLQQLIFNRPDLVYLAITAKGIAFYKDMIIVAFVKLLRIKLVLHFHNKGVSLRQNNFLDDCLYRIAFKRTKVILLSKFLYYDVEKYVNPQDIYICPNGIPKIIVKHSKPKKRKTINILFLSNLMKSKGVFILLEACSILKKKGFDFDCTFIGGEGDINRNQFQMKVESLHLDNFATYLGKKYGEEKEKYFSKADIFALPTLNDTFGLVILEAMQYSLPVVATIEGGIPDIVLDNETGYLVEKNDIFSLADRLETFIIDANLRIKMGSQGLGLFEERFTIDIFEKNFVSILKDLTTS